MPQRIAYTAFNKVDTIIEDGKELVFTYGHDRLRRMTQLKENSTLKQTKLFLGNYEKVLNETTGEEKEYHYLSAPTGLFAVVTKTEGGSEELNYVLTDHLGSIQTITDDEGELPTTYSYGAWGRLRNASTWSFTSPCDLPFFGRGYTGHEHLLEFGLINMNGRLYDPVLGRMLSPDNFVQSAGNSQNFNRYSYALNNPLIYTDPDGEWIHLVIGGIIGGIQGYMIGNQAGLSGWELVGTTLAGAGIGALSGGVGTSVSASSGVVAGAVVGGAVSGAGMGLTTGIATGQDFGTTLGMTIGGGFQGGILGLAGGTVGGAIGGGWGAFAGGATAGGLGAAMNSGSESDIINGALIGGAMGFGMYHLNSSISYNQYKNSGETFDGVTLSYRQFTGMSADFQRSEFWGREFGGVLTEDGGYVHRYKTHPLLNPEGQTRIHWDVENIPSNYFATSHSHYATPGTPAPNGGTYLQYHSSTDYAFDRRWNMSSFVVNKFDASFNSQTGHYSMPFKGNFYRRPYSLYFWGY